jgi:hypothetical protein
VCCPFPVYKRLPLFVGSSLRIVESTAILEEPPSRKVSTAEYNSKVVSKHFVGGGKVGWDLLLVLYVQPLRWPLSGYVCRGFDS